MYLISKSYLLKLKFDEYLTLKYFTFFLFYEINGQHLKFKRLL